MTQDVTKRMEVTFCIGRAFGQRALFTHDGELWIALPAEKHRRILAVTDRLIGFLTLVRKQMVSWLASNPGDAKRISMLLATIARAEEIHNRIADEKVQAVTA